MKTIITKINGIQLKIENSENITEKTTCELVTIFNNEYKFTFTLDNNWTYESLQKTLLNLILIGQELLLF